MKICISHHHACDCREHKVAVLVKAALDASVELDWMKSSLAASEQERDRMAQIVERMHSAIDEVAT